jgi:1-acyl-sn-glycerol-3-phosphate acyltransferase
MVTIRKLRLALHLLHGMGTIATRFPGASQARRREYTRDWTVRMLAVARAKLVVHNDAARVDARALVVGNHVSWLDIYAINAWRPTPFISKAEVRQWPVVGWLAEKLDTVFIQREKRSETKRIMHELASRLHDGELMCVFPEGTTSDGLGLLQFHSNMFQAAVEAGCLVQPVCIVYEDGQGRQSLAPAYIGELSLGQSVERVLRGGPLTVHVYVCEAFEAVGDRRELAARARASVAAALAQLQAGMMLPSEEARAELAVAAQLPSEAPAAAVDAKPAAVSGMPTETVASGE